MTHIITVGNFKGGVGKSTMTEILSYLLAKEHKILVIDGDPQQNLTERIRTTYKTNQVPELDLMDSIKEFNINKSIINVNNNLDLVVGDSKIGLFQEFVVNHLEEEAKYYLIYTLLSELDNVYDYILIDTRPSDPEIDVLTSNFICASDYVLMVAKTERDSYTSSNKYYDSISHLVRKNTDLKFLGIVPYLVNKRSSTDKKMLETFKNLFENDMFDNIIKHSERVKTWGRNGITEHLPHDKKTLKMYQNVCHELVERINRKKG